MSKTLKGTAPRTRGRKQDEMDTATEEATSHEEGERERRSSLSSEGSVTPTKGGSPLNSSDALSMTDVIAKMQDQMETRYQTARRADWEQQREDSRLRREDEMKLRREELELQREEMRMRREEEDRRYKLEDDRRRAEDDRRREEAQLHQARLLLMNKQLEEERESRRTGKGVPEHARFSDGDDVDDFLYTFGEHMKAFSVDRRYWTANLVPLLSDHLRKVYSSLDEETRADFDRVKAAILEYFDVNEETYRRKYQAATKKADEQWIDFYRRVSIMKDKWLKPHDTRLKVIDATTVEDVMAKMPERMRTWLRDQQPKTGREAMHLADNYVSNRVGEGEAEKKPPYRQTGRPTQQRPPWTDDRTRSVARPERSEEGKTRPWTQPKFDPSLGPRCFHCNVYGHIAALCPQKVATIHMAKDAQHALCCQGWIGKQKVDRMLLDTGATRTIVHARWAPVEALNGRTKRFEPFSGQPRYLPLADLELMIDGRVLRLEVGVQGDLQYDALLGVDVPFIWELGRKLSQGESIMAVHTRAQTRTYKEKEERELQLSRESEARTTPITQMAEEEQGSQGDESEQKPQPGKHDGGGGRMAGTDEGPYLSELAEELFGHSKERDRHSRSSNRRSRSTFASAADALHQLDGGSQKLHEAQQMDPSLEDVRRRAKEADGEFKMEGGLIYRRQKTDRPEEVVRQLVLPEEYRDIVLKTAHSIPMAGHLGRKKTTARLFGRFYWPGARQAVQDMCQRCPECQKTAKYQKNRVPMVPLPIIDEPFKRIAMDMVGPLPRSKAGYRYILTICDYATRFPEAIPLKSTDSETVADALMKLMAMVGVPEEILTDCGANFTSRLMKSLYDRLGVKGIRTSPYHPQTDGLVERFNCTMKQMLRKVLVKFDAQWDKALPYLMFAYREVPQESTGFSPFELLYGRQPRGPLDILKEEWEQAECTQESVVTYVQKVQNRLAETRKIVEQNEKRAKAEQERWYNRNARERRYEEGDMVLVLMPAESNELLMKWQGPYPILKRLSDTTYLIQMTDRRRQRRVFHVNMLAGWKSPSAVCMMVGEGEQPETNSGIEDIPSWNENLTDQRIIINPDLDEGQGKQLRDVLDIHSRVFSEKPGRTHRASIKIETGDAAPIHLHPYRLPRARYTAVQEEVKELLQAGLVEPSTSAWASPILLVPKKDGTHRLCVDYRRLNQITMPNSFPMPRIDDLIDGLASAHYISTLDLTKGYWQVPVDVQSRPKTAFITPMGKYQFAVMPFGLMGAPAVFQRLMNELLAGMTDYAAAYMDDVVIFSVTWETHLKHLGAVLGTLAEAGLTVKLGKCQLGMRECTYLGHVVGRGRVRPEEAKVMAVKNFKAPRTKKDMRAFLGLAGYYRRFIPAFSTIAAPLSDLTKKDKVDKVQWKEEHQRAFERLKEGLTSQAVLRGPDFDRQFVIQTDASDVGVGAVLSQVGDDGEEHPVAYYSRKLLPRERNYATVQKECLAVVEGVKHFRVYVEGTKFTVQTDHRCLMYLNQMRDTSSRLTRWSLALQPFNYTVTHRPGTTHGNADGLSRQAWEEPVTRIQKKGKEVSGSSIQDGTTERADGMTAP